MASKGEQGVHESAPPFLKAFFHDEQVARLLKIAEEEKLEWREEQAQRLQRIQEQKIFSRFSAFNVVKLVALSDEDFETVMDLEARHPDRHVADEWHRFQLKKYREDADYRRIVDVILTKMTADAITRFSSQFMAEAQAAPDLDAWIDRRMGIADRVLACAEERQENAQSLFRSMSLTEAKVALVEKWPDPTFKKIFAFILADPQLRPNESDHDFEARIRFWDAWIPSETRAALERWASLEKGAGRPPDAIRFMATRMSWVQALMDLGGEKGVQEMMQDAAALHTFLQGASCADGPRLEAQDQQQFAARTEVPVRVEGNGGEEYVGMFHEIVSQTGWHDLMKLCVRDVTLHVRPEGGVVGGYLPLNKTMDLNVSHLAMDARFKRLLPNTLFHETAHGLELFIRGAGGQPLIDRYAAALFFQRPDAVSSYAHAIKLFHGNISHVFLRESFAEDFLMFLEMPERIPEERRKILETIWNAHLKQVDLQETRQAIQKMFAQLFGVSIKDAAKEEVDCKVAASIAQQLEMRKKAREREDKKRWG